MTSQSQEAYQQAAAAAIVVLLVWCCCSTGWPSSSATSSSESGDPHGNPTATFTSTDSFNGSLDNYMNSIVDVQAATQSAPCRRSPRPRSWRRAA